MNVTGTQPQSNLVLGPLPPSSYQQPQGQQQQQQRGGSGNQNYPRQNYNKVSFMSQIWCGAEA